MVGEDPASPVALGVEHLNLSQRLARLGSWDRDYVTGVVRWSQELYRILGVEPGSVEPSAEALYLLLHPDDRQLLRSEYRRALAEGGEVFVVVRAVGLSRTLAVRGSLELDDEGNPRRSIGTVQDISDTTAPLQEPDSSLARLRATFDQAPVVTAPTGMALVDVRPGRPIRRLLVNQALADLMGLSRADLLQEPLEDRVHPADRACYVRLLSEVASGARDTVGSFEVRVVRPDTQERWVAISGHLFRDADAVPEYLVAHLQDITARKRAEQDARDRAARDARIAAVLQDNLLPFVSPRVGPMRVASRYLPAGMGELVGGDWTDVFALPNSRIGIVVGDVAGHGIEAAATMTRLRSVVRMLAANGLSPAGVLRRLNDSMHETEIQADVTMATLMHAQFDPATGILLHSAAGHPPLLIVPAHHADAPRLVVPVPAIGGPPLGVLPDLRYHEQAITLEPGSFLVGFTDGLIERRGHDLHESLLTLQTRLGQVPVDALTTVETLADAVLEIAPGGEAGDDVAVVVLAFDPLPDRCPAGTDTPDRRPRDADRPTAASQLDPVVLPARSTGPPPADDRGGRVRSDAVRHVPRVRRRPGPGLELG